MSHFVLRRIGRFNERHGHVPTALSEALKAAPVRVFSDHQLQQMKQACAANGDVQRLLTLEDYERSLEQARIKH